MFYCFFHSGRGMMPLSFHARDNNRIRRERERKKELEIEEV